MKRKKINTQDERQILIGMITSKEFLDRLVPILDPKLLSSRMSQTIAFWVVEYYKEHDDAPGVHFEDIYRTKVKKDPNMDENLESMMQDFLDSLSSEYERAKKFNVGYVFKKAKEHLVKNKIRVLISNLRTLISEGQIQEADQIAIEYSSIPTEISQAVNIFQDQEAMRNAFTSQGEPLFMMPGAVGELLNEDIRRGSFMAFMGREKIGKTFWLMEFGMKSSMQRCRTIFFQAGDMTEEQQIRRVAIRMARKSDKAKYCGKVYLPILDCQHNQTDVCDLKYRACDFGLGINEYESFQEIFETYDSMMERIELAEEDEYTPCSKCFRKRPKLFKGSVWFEQKDLGDPLDWRGAWKESRKVYTRLRMRDFWLSSHFNRTLTVQKIKSILLELEIRYGFIPDVIIIDYADILLPPPGDFRQGQNIIWQELRALAQERNAFVLTATQADAASYSADRLGLKNFTEDKRKYSHVTSIWGLNQLPWEKMAGLMRINPLMMRDDDFSISREAKVIQSLKTGRPLIKSFF